MADFIRDGSGSSNAKEKIRREADFHDIELETIRKVDSDGVGTTYRVLETDGESEADQVGFDVTHPDGPAGEQMFSNKLNDSFQALKQYLDGEDPNEATDEVVEEHREELEEHRAQTAQQDEQSQTSDDEQMSRTTIDPEQGTVVRTDPDPDLDATKIVNEQIEVTVGFSDEQVEDIEDAFVEAIERRDERIDELEDRVDRLEDLLSGLADLGGALDDE